MTQGDGPHGMTGKGNLVVFEYIDPHTGKVEVSDAFPNEPRLQHSETVGFSWFKAQGIPYQNITRIYSVLSPCDECAPNISELAPQAHVYRTWDRSQDGFKSYFYRSNFGARRK